MRHGLIVTFYAAVCEEFHDMEAFYGGLTMEEAAEKYREIRNDPRLGYFGNTMGFVLHDPVASPEMDIEYPLIQGAVPGVQIPSDGRGKAVSVSEGNDRRRTCRSTS